MSDRAWTNNEITEVLQRIARLESKVEDQTKGIEEIKGKLNGYLENRIKLTVKAMIGEIVIASLIGSGGVAALVTFLMGKFGG